MTRLLDDILREPRQLAACLNRLVTSQIPLLQKTASLLRRTHTTFVVGVGSSWNAALAVATLLNSAGYPAAATDASELLHFATIPEGATLIVLSRSGRSVEIVRLLDKFHTSKATVIAITNTPDSPLGKRSQVTFRLESPFDYLISISMYSMLALVGGLIAETCRGNNLEVLRHELTVGLELTEARLEGWMTRIENSEWSMAHTPVYFLARGSSLASCHEARLLWEEAAKTPATALTTGSFRHGSQEIVRPGLRIGLWLQNSILRAEDLQLAADMREAGASVLLVGSNLADAAADLILELPAMPAGWQFLTDIIPLQLAAEFTARRNDQDCDVFRFCPYVIEEEGGLTAGAAAAD